LIRRGVPIALLRRAFPREGRDDDTAEGPSADSRVTNHGMLSRLPPTFVPVSAIPASNAASLVVAMLPLRTAAVSKRSAVAKMPGLPGK